VVRAGSDKFGIKGNLAMRPRLKTNLLQRVVGSD